MCHKTEEPIYITKNGYGDMVIMSMEIYESTMKQIAMYRDIEKIHPDKVFSFNYSDTYKKLYAYNIKEIDYSFVTWHSH